MKVKIFGAGSIGNHLAHASRSLDWQVTVCDVQETALQRMRGEIYPSRYGKWDESIRLSTNAAAPRGGFDLIIVGTPPEWHIPLALEALREKPRGVLVEKSLCPPSMEGMAELDRQSQASGVKVFVGYTHVVGRAMQAVDEILKSGELGEIRTLDVEFREHWEGIFRAHPWLTGPQDTYLGYWKRGGGASGEHSHAINLWQHLAHTLGLGSVVDVSAALSYVREGEALYDDLCLLNLRTERGLIGRVVQDVVTRPARKWARVQGGKAALEWVANYNAEGDAIILLKSGWPNNVQVIPKKRPDDFIEELKHVQTHLDRSENDSTIRLERGMETMRVLEALHRSAAEGKNISIDHARPQASKPVAMGART